MNDLEEEIQQMNKGSEESGAGAPGQVRKRNGSAGDQGDEVFGELDIVLDDDAF